MKKHKILVVALAMAVMCTGAGYAYWTQALTINNTVNTSFMDVGFLCATDEDWDDGDMSIPSDFVKVDTDVSTDRHSIAFTVTDFYPGAGAGLDFRVKNTGKVAAKIDSVEGNITYNAALCNALDFSFTTVEITRDGRHIVIDIDDVAAEDVSDLAIGLTNALKDIVLQPGDIMKLYADPYTWNGDDSVYPGYNILMPGEEIVDDQFENQRAEFNLKLNFKQVN